MEKQLRKFTELIGFRYFLIIILILTGGLQFAFMYGNVKGVTYDFKPLQLAPETVRSTKTIEDTYKTQLEREKLLMQWIRSINFRRMSPSKEQRL